MSVGIGDRATHRGQSIVVFAEASFLGERRWYVRWREGEAFTGWSSEIALESALSDLSTPSWEIGDTVRVGYAPYHRSGTVTDILSMGTGRPLYEVTFPDDPDRYNQDGLGFMQHVHSVVVGAEVLDV